MSGRVRGASAVIGLLGGEGVAVTLVQRRGVCAYCNKESVIAWTEADERWEFPGHPDHIDRDVCGSCSQSAIDRMRLASEVLSAMRKQMEKGKSPAGDIEKTLKKARSEIDVQFKDDVLLSTAQKLGIKHAFVGRPPQLP